MKKKSINPGTLFDSRQFGFSQVISTPPGQIVFISGQVSWDENLNIIGENDLAVQTQKSIDNLEIAIKSAGGCLEDIVMLRIYVVEYQKENGPLISQILKDNFGTSSPPASTWINVKGLANEKFMIEIEAQAVIQK